MASKLEYELLTQIREQWLVAPVTEYRFHATRKWRFDIAWPSIKVAVEIEGGTWVSGRHNRGTGFESDCEKYNAAVIDGWKVLRFTSNQVSDGKALKVIEELVPYIGNEAGK